MLLFGVLSFGLAKSFCIKAVENPYAEPYLDYLLIKSVERAVLASGYKLDCAKGSQEISPAVELLKETPIAYTPQQRVSAYSLELKLSLRIGQEKKTFSVSVPYSQPEGGVGDLPRRAALEDALSIIYTEILQFIGRR